ncbi:MarR family transcriptional regulator [Glaciecola sp. XM2]|jgi:DNA-binding MarR family transcriptional regulator|uniref:MarR family winged helix-turn-helix transcriptional regulator n=1 Tax=Glaciecola sp. XM2 TaxID=1914931 RepID=UPI001BDE8D01|nr:MarR family transcriptional regulator [Glaciecola sp. XM2]MBT1452060.1 MarR family transcriptional regulator [Glaciecola sp. XM2]
MSKLLENGPVEAEKLLINLDKISRKLSSNRTKDLLKYELKKSSFEILYALLVEPTHQLKPTQLMKITGITSGSLTTRVDKLVEKDYVRRVKDKNDKRVKSIKIKKKGLTLITEVVKTHNEQIEQLIAPLTEEDCKGLNGLLNKWLTANA